MTIDQYFSAKSVNIQSTIFAVKLLWNIFGCSDTRTGRINNRRKFEKKSADLVWACVFEICSRKCPTRGRELGVIYCCIHLQWDVRNALLQMSNSAEWGGWVESVAP